MKIQNEIFNGIEYTLVDVYELDNNKIYHFLSDDDELFCVKNEQEKYVIIEDEEKIERIKEENGLIMPEYMFAMQVGPIGKKLLGVENVEEINQNLRNKLLKETEEELSKLNNVARKNRRR